MTQETERQYLKIIASLLGRYERETRCSWRDNPLELVIWLGEQRRRWKKPTWRKYRAAIRWHLKAQDAIEAVNLLNTLSSAPARKSHHRRGRMPEDEFQQLVDNLRKRSGRRSLLAIALLCAGRATGLRPCREWHGAQLIQCEDHLELVVHNAKHDKVRGNGPTRTLILLPDLPKLDLVSIELVLETANAVSYPEWKAEYDRLRKRIEYWRPKNSRVSPYSARHQFAANSKAKGLKKTRVAALLGHASDQTAGRHYGRRIHGRGGVHVAVKEAEVATVRSSIRDDGPSPG